MNTPMPGRDYTGDQYERADCRLVIQQHRSGSCRVEVYAPDWWYASQGRKPSPIEVYSCRSSAGVVVVVTDWLSGAAPRTGYDRVASP